LVERIDIQCRLSLDANSVSALLHDKSDILAPNYANDEAHYDRFRERGDK
jgi:hypothetical protein